jgi:hypothetical protein
MNHPIRPRFSFVLAAILVYWVVAPLLRPLPGLRIFTDIFFTATLASAIYAVAQVRRHWMVAAGLALPMFAALWLTHLGARPALALVGSIFEILFFAYTAWLILAAVLRATEVSWEVIAAAVVVYMFLGMIWAGLYSTLELLNPGSFSMANVSTGPTSQQFGYFSFTTLTTLGYGDIAPLSGAARAFATLEAMVGQIYLTVLIARLVGAHIAQSSG